MQRTHRGELDVTARFTRGGEIAVPRYMVADVTPDNRNDMVTLVHTQGDLLSARAVSEAEGMPITLGHPEGWVTSDNYTVTARGFAKRAWIDGGYLMGTMRLTDADTITKVEKGGFRENSVGYAANFTEIGKDVFLPLSDFDLNHSAIVKAGAAGPENRILMHYLQAEDVEDMNEAQIKALVLAIMAEHAPKDDKETPALSADELASLVAAQVAVTLEKTESAEQDPTPAIDTGLAVLMHKVSGLLPKEFTPTAEMTRRTLLEAAMSASVDTAEKSDAYLEARLDIELERRAGASKQHAELAEGSTAPKPHTPKDPAKRKVAQSNRMPKRYWELGPTPKVSTAR